VTLGLDGSASYDPEGAILSYRWTDDHGVTYTGATPSVTILGTVTIAHFTLVVNDGIQDSPPSTVTVRLGDVTPPALGPHADVGVEQLTRAGTNVAFTPPIVSDDVDPAPRVSLSASPGATFPLGTTPVVCWRRTRAGTRLSSRSSFTSSTRTPPVMSATPDIHKNTLRPDGDFVAYATPTASDVCDANPAVSCTPASGSFFFLGTTVVTCRATDASGIRLRETFK